jgi:hypothetical protein
MIVSHLCAGHRSGEPIYVHAKIMIIDDRLRIDQQSQQPLHELRHGMRFGDRNIGGPDRQRLRAIRSIREDLVARHLTVAAAHGGGCNDRDLLSTQSIAGTSAGAGALKTPYARFSNSSRMPTHLAGRRAAAGNAVAKRRYLS